MVAGFEEAKVSDLINPLSKNWDFHLLNDLFAPQEAELISSIPLCHSNVEDKLIWPYASLGIYLVKSDYNFLAKENSTINLAQDNPM